MGNDAEHLRFLREQADLHRALADEARSSLSRSKHTDLYVSYVTAWRELSAQLALERSNA